MNYWTYMAQSLGLITMLKTIYMLLTKLLKTIKEKSFFLSHATINKGKQKKIEISNKDHMFICPY